MRIPTLGVLAVAALGIGACAGATAVAQQEDGPRPIAIGDTVAGMLAADAPTYGERGRFRVYSFRGRAGQRVAIRMDSDKFDPYLVLARNVAGLTDEVATDDDGGDGLNALLRAILPDDGTYLIVAQALSDDEENGLGEFTLSLGLEAPPPPPQPIAFGRTTTGELEDGDPALISDGSRYDLWSFRGRAGQHVLVRMESDDFDAFLTLGRLDASADPEEMQQIDADDDGAGGTDALIRVVLDEDGEYAIRANALDDDGRGAYTLRLEEWTPVPVPAPTRITAGETVRGDLSDDDPLLDDDAYFDHYVVRARRGDRLTIELRSEEFDTYLRLGTMDGDDFRQVASNDDGAEGTDSRLEYEVEEDGAYVIRVTSFNSGATGAYTLDVESARR